MITTVSSTAALLAALKVAHDGDTILLAAGSYDAVTLSGINFASGVTIASADSTHEAVLSNLTVLNSSGLTFQQLNVTTAGGTAATVAGSHNITFSQDAFSDSATGAGNAMMLRNSSNITVTGSDFGHLGTGINALTDSNLTISNNTFHNISSGAVRGTAVTSSTISGNTFTDASSTVASHVDVINLWQDNAANNVAVTGNAFGSGHVVEVNSTTQLLNALKTAHAGDTIELAAGTYSSAVFSNINIAGGAVTITSEDPTHHAVFSNMTVSGSSGLDFEQVTVTTAGGTAATVSGSNNITFGHDSFSDSASGTGNGMMLRNDAGVTVTGSDFTHLGTAINVLTDSGLSITNNDFHGVNSGDIRGTSVTTSTISGNTFADAKSTVANHTDVLYLWQDNTANHVTISSNVYGTGTSAVSTPPVTTTSSTGTTSSITSSTTSSSTTSSSTTGTTTTSSTTTIATTSSSSGPQTVTVSNTDQLMTALKTAHAGDTIQLAAGTYNAVSIANMHFTTPVTITSATSNEAVISGITVGSSSGITFDHLDVGMGSNGVGVYVGNSSNLTFSNLTVEASAVGTGLGMELRSSSGLTVTNSVLAQLGSGIAQIDTTGVTISHNNFHDIATDGIDSAGAINAVVSGNTFTDFFPETGAHPDAIQFFGDSAGVQSSNVLVADNVITRGSGDPIQGIFVSATNHIEITGNALNGTMYNGVALSGVTDGLISNNFVEGYSDMGTQIIVRGGSANVTVTGNTAEQISNYVDAGVLNTNYQASGNTIIPVAAVGDQTALNAWLSHHTASTASLTDSFFLH